jgi:hypothetical protein
LILLPSTSNEANFIFFTVVTLILYIKTYDENASATGEKHITVSVQAQAVTDMFSKLISALSVQILASMYPGYAGVSHQRKQRGICCETLLRICLKK